MAFSASGTTTQHARVVQFCRVLLRVRLVVSVFAVLLLLLGSEPTVRFAVAFVFAVLTSLLAYLFWQRITGVLTRHPILLSLDTVVSLLVLTAGQRAAPFLIFTVVTSAIAGLLYRWAGMLYITVLQMLCLVTAVAIEVGAFNLEDSVSLLAPCLYYPLLGFAGLWVRRSLEDADRADAARHAAEVEVAAESERARLARDMHDSLAKTIRGIAFSAAALPNWILRDSERAAAEAGRVAAAAEVASREARDLLADLRSSRLDLPLTDVVGESCNSWAERTGIAMDLEVADAVELQMSARYELVNVLEEALSNIEQHAGAEHVTVRLTEAGDLVRLTVTDDGSGFDTDTREVLVTAGHYGLLGMSERATRAGGQIDVESSPGSGTSISVTAPRHRTIAADVSSDGKEPAGDELTMETR